MAWVAVCGVALSRLRERLFERYDAHYLRANALAEERLSASDYQKHMPEYEACFARIVSTLPKGSQIVDVGCGIGLLLYWLERRSPGHFQLTGVDLSQSQLAHARKHLPAVITLVHERASVFLERNAHVFSAIFCTDMLEHIESEDELLRLMELAKQSLMTGGFLISQVPNMANLTSLQTRYIDLTHTRGFTVPSLLQLLECVGFRDCQIVRREAADTTQGIRMFMENMIHRMIYRVCGVGDERHFQRNLIGVGRA
jgi:2-polyprenyl-3-methyl-5-hydroxy-6-metoxy-1,4-benzoquinol methylase